MRYELNEDQLEDMRQRLELIYGRSFDADETQAIAARILELYEDLKGTPPTN